MKFLCLACGDESAWNRLATEQQQSYIQRCSAFDRELAGDSRVRLYAGLNEGGRIIRTRAGERIVTDGPFIESKEIGGVFIVEADDLDEAVELAAMHPAGRMGEELGWYVAVRPLFIPEIAPVSTGASTAGLSSS